jgi:stage V sporulation protein R
MAGLSEDLRGWKKKIENYAHEYGLDFFELNFEVIDYRQLNEVASYGGFPVRYPHWTHGMSFDQLSKGYTYGLSKIYEMVINNDPCYAYLMKENHLVDQKLVMCHVYGHCDFFKNNVWFSRTDRQMIDTMANHASRIRRYIGRYGLEEVENFLDRCVSLERLIDVHSAFLSKQRTSVDETAAPEQKQAPRVRFEAKSYMESFINASAGVQEERHRREQEEKERQPRKFPESPERDVLLFLLHHAPLTRWQRDILGMIRDESYYFAPQWQTKIMNEGWASYWHSKLMTEKVLNDAEIVDFADHHSGTMGGNDSLNPYKLGLYLYRDIEERWNKGRYGSEYEDCENYKERKNWDTGAGKGRQKIFEVRTVHNDVTFIDTFLTEEFAQENRMFIYRYDLEKDQYVIASREFSKIKRQLLAQLTNGGHPLISIIDADYKGHGILYLKHTFEGIPLDIEYAKATLANLHALWGKPVCIESVYQDKPVLIEHDGKEAQLTTLDAPSSATA